MSEELKGCPFCGGTDLKAYQNLIECRNTECGAQGPDMGQSHPQNAIDGWNRRHTPEVVGLGVYVASKACHWPMWQEYRAAGKPIISTWIDEGADRATQDFPDLWRRCVAEAAVAQAIIIYREDGEVLKGALIEIGAAMANGKPVYAVGDFDGTYHNHPLFHQCGSLDEAFSRASSPTGEA